MENFTYVDDDSWSGTEFVAYTKPTVKAPLKFTEHSSHIDSSFILALKHKRYRLVDVILNRHMESCVGEMTRIKADPGLHLKWTTFIGIDNYIPLYLVWTIAKQRRAKKEKFESRGLTRLPQNLIREIIKYT